MRPVRCLNLIVVTSIEQIPDLREYRDENQEA